MIPDCELCVPLLAGPTVWRLSIGLGVQFVVLDYLKEALVYRRQLLAKSQESAGGHR